jgi:uncharacterized protein YcsI (UPF0317 family)
MSESAAVRHDIRAAIFRGATAGLAPGRVQANLVILPAALAEDFGRYCAANPKPCPVLARSQAGEPSFPTLGVDIDLRTDLPRYRVWRRGELVEEPEDIRRYWRDDLVAFAIGCSFTFEHLLMDAGIRLRHVEQGRNVAMYRTSIPTAPAGVFRGPLVVSMRPLRPADAIRAVEITAGHPRVHGAPVHLGLPALIGIRDLARPDWGDAVEVMADELPVFWACGVTPQAAIAEARPDFCITHAPGCMLVTDLHHHQLASL